MYLPFLFRLTRRLRPINLILASLRDSLVPVPGTRISSHSIDRGIKIAPQHLTKSLYTKKKKIVSSNPIFFDR